MLNDVSAAVRAYTGQYFTRTETTERLTVDRGTVRLTQHPVHAVTTVTDLTGAEIVASWNGLDRVTLDPGPAATFVTIPVDVTYDHGYDTIPADIVAVVCHIVARSLGSPAEDARLTGQSIDGYSEQFGTIGAAGPFGLFADEQRILDRYRRHVGIAWMS
jgi:hypothetical protein